MALKKISFFKSEETGFLLFTPLEKIKEKKLIWGGGEFRRSPCKTHRSVRISIYSSSELVL